MSHHTSLIQKAQNRVLIDIPWGDTKDIISSIMTVANDNLEGQVKAFAQQYKGRDEADQYQKLKKLWAFTKYEIKYKVDGNDENGDPLQDINHPARTYSLRQRGVDCKSKTLFNYFVLKAIGIPCFIRFAAYKYNLDGTLNKRKEIGHVYPVCIVGGRTVAVDSVFDYFDAEESAVRLVDKIPDAWKSEEVVKLSRQSLKSAIGRTSANIYEPQHRWVTGSFAVLSGIQAIRAKTFLEKLLYGGLSIHFARQTIRK